MDHSIFMEKELVPTDEMLEKTIKNTFNLWQQIRNSVVSQYPEARKEWNFPGKKYGWSFRIKDKKRAIIYLLPRENYFKVAFVFGEKAIDKIMQSNINQEIKTELSNAKKYAEGRGIRIDVSSESVLYDINLLISIKLAH